MGHGSMYHRRPGSMGSTSTQVEFIKERTYQDIWVMKTVTVQNLEIVKSRYGQKT